MFKKGVIMQQYSSLKVHYKFTEEEAQILQDFQPRMEKLVDKFIDEFYEKMKV